MAITAKQVKELRDSSGVGMMDAKKALTATDGDMEAAVDWLRTKGLASAAKKSARTAAEGLVGVAVSGNVAVAVEVNSETDFVAKNAEFQELVAGVTTAALGVSDVEALQEADMGGKTVSTVVGEKIATIGENMTVRRMAKLEGDVLATYVHNAAAPDLGLIGVIVALKGGNEEIAKQICMHVAATNPASLNEDDLSEELVAREKAIFVAKATEDGKSEAGIESWSNKQVAKFIKDVVLVNQKFVINSKQTVAQAAKEAGAEVTGFVRLAVGEGIEKKVEDFAAEVAKTMGG